MPWIDSAIEAFITRSESPLVSTNRRLGQEFSWMIDRTLETDSAHYTIAQVGHDQTEPDGSNPRFVTDAWLYVDTVRKRIYEYDLPNDSLVLWSN